jgi:hypothetical protein
VLAGVRAPAAGPSDDGEGDGRQNAAQGRAEIRPVPHARHLGETCHQPVAEARQIFGRAIRLGQRHSRLKHRVRCEAWIDALQARELAPDQGRRQQEYQRGGDFRHDQPVPDAAIPAIASAAATRELHRLMRMRAPQDAEWRQREDERRDTGERCGKDERPAIQSDLIQARHR